MELAFSIIPIILLIFLMTKKNGMPSFKALPLTAILVYLIVLVIFRFDPTLVHASVIEGFLISWTPILIIAGAIFLFRTMEKTGALEVIRQWLNSISGNKVAQLMIVGWAFPFLIEGASGFGTPAAIAAPILVGLGFPPVRVAILALVMNSIPVSFGAVGTPTWFGFSTIPLNAQQILEISFKSAVVNGMAALIIPLFALGFIVKWKSIRENMPFIYLSILVTVIPYVIVARFNFEFPALLGGFIGLVGTVFLAKKGTGISNKNVELHQAVEKEKLVNENVDASTNRPVSMKSLVKATFPLWGTIIILIVTRIPQLGIKGLLNLSEPAVSFGLGVLGTLKISASLVLGLEGILRTLVDWEHSLLYVPSIIPFVLVSGITFMIYGSGRKSVRQVVTNTYQQMKKPALALFGALIFVNLMMMGGESSPVTLIGQGLAKVTGGAWQYFAAYLGALGSFFSGSNTISNLTFGGIQYSIASALNLDVTTILALQSVGGAMGNMVCINNIVAVASVLALGNQEGFILKKTVWPMVVYGIVAALMSLLI
jgi:lactate permease